MTAKDHTLPGKLIHVCRREFLLSLACILPKHPEITGTQIVTQDEDNIWTFGLFRFGRHSQGQQRGKQAEGKGNSYFHN